MSSLNRIISGTSAGLTRQFFLLVITIISMPIYLSFWSLDTYGAWILILTLTSILKTPLFSHQEYLSQEFLKLGKKNRKEISKVLYGSLIVTFIYSLLLLFFINLLINYTSILIFFKIDSSLINIAKLAIIIIFTLELSNSVVSLLSRALYPFKYYPIISWLGLFGVIIIPLGQIFGVILGYKLIGLSIITFSIVNLINFFYIIYFGKCLKKEKILFIKYDFLKNLNHLKNSFYLVIGKLSVLFKEQGVRLVLAPMLGNIQMVGYVAMRTASNFMKQIFSTFSNSLRIEFIDYINEKNKKNFLYTYVSLYFIFSLIIIPFSFFFQIIAPTVFEIWTRDKIIFDPILFGSMTISFLIMVFYNPASMIISGKNLFKKDLLISIFTSVIFILLLIFLLSTFSMRGAGYSLVILEIFTCFLTFYFANKWLKKEFIIFNPQIILFSLIDLIISSIFIYILITGIINIKYIIFVFIAFKIIFGIFFLKLLPKKIKKKLLF